MTDKLDSYFKYCRKLKKDVEKGKITVDSASSKAGRKYKKLFKIV